MSREAAQPCRRRRRCRRRIRASAKQNVIAKAERKRGIGARIGCERGVRYADNTVMVRRDFQRGVEARARAGETYIEQG
jgi:hypothetical protein